MNYYGDVFIYIYNWWEESPPTLVLSYPFIIEYTLNSGTLVHNTVMSCLRCCLVWFSKFEQKGLMELTSSFGLTFFYDYATPSKVVLWLASIFSGIILCVLVSKLIYSLVVCEFYICFLLRFDNMSLQTTTRSLEPCVFLIRTVWLCIFKMKLLDEGFVLDVGEILRMVKCGIAGCDCIRMVKWKKLFWGVGKENFPEGRVEKMGGIV